MKEIISMIPPGEFCDHRVLVVGGSRGLGELVAKIVAAGGAEVVITYAQGANDAEKVRAEVMASGRRCSTRRLNVSEINSSTEFSWLQNSLFSHVYFFASPLITKNTGPWCGTLFAKFSDVYVSAFAALVERTIVARERNQRIRYFYPSSVFVGCPEPGFLEYTVAKAAGERLCDGLESRYGVRVDKPRLPGLRTDQTGSLGSDAADPFPVMLEQVRKLHSPS